MGKRKIRKKRNGEILYQTQAFSFLSKSFQRFLMLIFKAYVYNLLSYEQNVAGLT